MITIDFIRHEVKNQTYEISIHADDERLNDELTIEEIEFVLRHCELIEKYHYDERGESCLVFGNTSKKQTGAYRVWKKSTESFVHHHGIYTQNAQMAEPP